MLDMVFSHTFNTGGQAGMTNFSNLPLYIVVPIIKSDAPYFLTPSGAIMTSCTDCPMVRIDSFRGEERNSIAYLYFIFYYFGRVSEMTPMTFNTRRRISYRMDSNLMHMIRKAENEIRKKLC